eukprot:11728-Heterococcus_DN1.PRE.2
MCTSSRLQCVSKWAPASAACTHILPANCYDTDTNATQSDDTQRIPASCVVLMLRLCTWETRYKAGRLRHWHAALMAPKKEPVCAVTRLSFISPGRGSRAALWHVLLHINLV